MHSKNSPEKPKELGVIFDFDGVIVDTHAALYSLYEEVVSQHGVVGTRDEFSRLDGLKLEEIVADLIAVHGLAGRDDALRAAFTEGFATIHARARLVEGVAELVHSLKTRGFTLGVASAAQRTGLEGALRGFGLWDAFSVVVTGDDVLQAKPHPEIYLRAQAGMNCEMCCVVEDSSNGLQAAVAAGLPAIHFDPSGRGATGGYTVYSVRSMLDLLDIFDAGAILVAKPKRIALSVHTDARELDARTKRQVAEYWERSVNASPSLMDGRILHCFSWKLDAAGTLFLHTVATTYRWYYAQVKGAAPRTVNILAVSGFSVDDSGDVLLGKRSQSVTEYVGCFEPIPSGALEPEDVADGGWQNRLLSEFAEETSLDKNSIKNIRPLALVYDIQSGAYDIVGLLQYNGDFDPEQCRSKEYDAYRLLDAGNADGDIAGIDLSPMGRLLRHLKNDVFAK